MIPPTHAHVLGHVSATEPRTILDISRRCATAPVIVSAVLDDLTASGHVTRDGSGVTSAYLRTSAAALAIRHYLTSCPVWVDVAPDGTVSVNVDLSELDDAVFSQPLYDGDGQELDYDEATREADRTRIVTAVMTGAVRQAGLEPPPAAAQCSVCLDGSKVLHETQGGSLICSGCRAKTATPHPQTWSAPGSV